MTSQISFNPVITTNAAGGFASTLDGFIQGIAMDDPSTRFALAGGKLSVNETLPMWGGVLVYEDIPAVGSVGRVLGRATSLANATGISVFDQAHAMINTPQSPVPLSGTYMDVGFYRFGSGARIAVACDPALVSLQGGLINQQVSWDYGGQFLSPYTAAWAANVITAATYAGTTVTLTTTSAHGLSVGSDFDLSGFVNTGLSLNGTWKAIAGTTGSTITFTLASTFGTVTTYGTLVAGGGALPCKILDVSVGNSMTVVYNTTTGFATWNRNGTVALIQI